MAKINVNCIPHNTKQNKISDRAPCFCFLTLLKMKIKIYLYTILKYREGSDIVSTNRYFVYLYLTQKFYTTTYL